MHDKTIGFAYATNQRTDEECSTDTAVTASAVVGGVSSGDDVDSMDSDGSSSNDDAGAVETTGAGKSDVDGDESNSTMNDGEGRPSAVVVGAAAALGVLALATALVWMAVLGRRRWTGGAYRHTQLGGRRLDRGGGGGGVFEMSDTSRMAERHGDEVEDDFLQAEPSSNGKDSHFYRSSSASGGGKRVIRAGDDAGAEDHDEVDRDLGGDTRGGRGRGAVQAGAGRTGTFGRFLGGREQTKFAPFADSGDEAGNDRPAERRGDS